MPKDTKQPRERKVQLYYPEGLPEGRGHEVLAAALRQDRPDEGLRNGDRCVAWMGQPVAEAALALVQTVEQARVGAKAYIGRVLHKPDGGVCIHDGQQTRRFKPEDISRMGPVCHVERRGKIIKKYPKASAQTTRAAAKGVSRQHGRAATTMEPYSTGEPHAATAGRAQKAKRQKHTAPPEKISSTIDANDLTERGYFKGDTIVGERMKGEPQLGQTVLILWRGGGETHAALEIFNGRDEEGYALGIYGDDERSEYTPASVLGFYRVVSVEEAQPGRALDAATEKRITELRRKLNNLLDEGEAHNESDEFQLRREIEALERGDTTGEWPDVIPG